MKKTFVASLVSLLLLGSFGVFTYTGAATACSDSFGCDISHQECVDSVCVEIPVQSGNNTAVSPAGPSGDAIHTSITISNPFDVCGASGCGLLDFLHAVINNIIMPLVGVLIVLAFIWTGFKYVMARGNSTKIGEANKMLRYTVIGAAILLAASAITDLITGTLNQFQTLK